MRNPSRDIIATKGHRPKGIIMNREQFMENESIMVQNAADDKFRNYMSCKVAFVVQERKIDLENERPILWLRYPGPRTTDEKQFRDFFEAPVSCCMAIDMSEYIDNPNSEMIDLLATCVNESSDIVFVLYAMADDLEKTRALARVLNDRLGLKKQCFRNHNVTPEKRAFREFGY